MRFYTLKEKKPEYGEEVLAKIRCSRDEDFYYYVVCRTTKAISDFVEGKWTPREIQDIYEEAMGEEYSFWREKEIIGWTSFDEIEKNERWHD